MGKTWYEDGHIAYSVHPGEIGQWQNGVFEVIGRKEKATADLVYPKADWPEPKPEEINKK